MSKRFLSEVQERAVREIEEELFEALVEKQKEKIRNRVPWWRRLFPWKIVRRD